VRFAAERLISGDTGARLNVDLLVYVLLCVAFWAGTVFAAWYALS
jgi:hypothetical protein